LANLGYPYSYRNCRNLLKRNPETWRRSRRISAADAGHYPCWGEYRLRTRDLRGLTASC